MCGIAGGWWIQSPHDLDEKVSLSLERMRNRGPDDRGYEYFHLPNGQLVLGHTRLSIIDLSSAGHQPMLSGDGRWALVFNGEIYNYVELRRELETLGYSFVSDSDTEVLLYSWAHWRQNCLTRLIGMFAFVVYDKEEHQLFVARDAFGIKPLFYDFSGSRFLFASDINALLALREERPEPDWQRAYDYLVHGDYDSQERSFIKGVKHLMPGHWLKIDLLSGHGVGPTLWWKPDTRQTSPLSFDQAVEAVRAQFLQNVRLHLRSDVALGAALSGGIDSSAVVCAIRHVEPELPINTFSYIARGSSLSEEQWVDRINAHVGAKAHKVTASSSDLVRDLDAMLIAQGEPFGSTSIYAQYRVFQLAREQGVTVTLDGQGADELLAGYTGYPGQRLLSLLEQGKLREALVFSRRWGQWPGRSLALAWMSLARVVLPDDWYAKARKILGQDFRPAWLKNELLQEAGVNFREERAVRCRDARGRRVVEQLADALQRRGLPFLLRHGDRNSMQFSVESRVPFLTLPMAELLLSLPEEYLISRSGETKHVFRAAMRGIVPDDVLDRKDKIGFATPEQEWLREIAPTLRIWLQDSASIPFMNREALLAAFDSVMEGKSKFSWQLWRWINYVRWYRNVF